MPEINYGLAPEVEAYLNQLVVTGDQNGFGWDPLLKIFLAETFGFTNIEQQIHTADIFSMRRVKVNVPTVMHEAFNFKGDLLRWTASCEAADFLGRMPIHPRFYADHGIDLRRVAAYLGGQDINKLVVNFTQGDWRGLVLPGDRLVAEGVHMNTIHNAFSQLSRPLRQNMIYTLHGPGKKSGREYPKHVEAALEIFDQTFNMHQYGDEFWGEAMGKHWSSLLPLFGLNGSTCCTTSVHSFRLQGFNKVRETHPFLALFYDNYELARAAYNQAVEGEGEAMKKLEEGELPFFVIIRDFDGIMRRRELTYVPQSPKPNAPDPLVKMLMDINREEGAVLALLGKAIPHVAEVRMRAPMIMPRKGSAYLEKALRFELYFQQALGKRLPFHPLIRIDPNALDGLADVEGFFYLPSYLHKPFGVDVETPIQAREFAAQWRDVVAAAATVTEYLRGFEFTMKPDQQTELRRKLRYMVGQGILPEGIRKETNSLIRRILAYEKKRAEAARQSRGKIPDDVLQEGLEVNVLRSALGVYQNAIMHFMATSLRDLRNIQDLVYWNARPFAHWILALPGWKDAIQKRTRVYIEPASTHPDLKV